MPINISGNRVIATQARLPNHIYGCYVNFDPGKDWKEEVCVHNNVVISSVCSSHDTSDDVGNRIHLYGGAIDVETIYKEEYKNGVYANCNRVEIVNSRSRYLEAYGGYVKICHEGASLYHRFNFSSVETSSNTVIIDGGEFWRHSLVCGGYIVVEFKNYGRQTCLSCPMRATNNTVTIKGSPDLRSARIYGGRIENSAISRDVYLFDVDSFSGNKLNIESRIRGTVEWVKNFEEYNFSKVEVNAPVVLSLEKGVDLSRSKVGVKVEGEAREGDRLNLIESQEPISPVGVIKVIGRGGLIEYESERSENPRELALMIRGLRATPQAQGINRAVSAGMVVVGQGIGFIADRGIEEAVRAVKGKEEVEVFGAVEADRSKYKNVTDVKIEAMKAAGGIAKSYKEGEVVAGLYVEHGKGDYKIEEVESEGDVRYTGVGGLVRKWIGEKRYIEGSVNVGGYGIEYKNEIRGKEEEDLGYDYKGMYEGVHIGCGYEIEASRGIEIGITGKMLVTRQEGKQIKLNNGEPIEIEGVTVGKVGGGLKMKSKCSEKILPYVGIGYEYGIFGEGKGKVEGISLKEIDLKGGTGIGEIGIESRIGELRIELRGRGNIGKREAIEGLLKVGYTI
jgi:hypothetical protein